MNLILIAIATLSSANVFAVCATPISRTNIGANSVLTATRYNADVNTAYNRANNLPGDCVVDGSVTTAKIAAGAITSVKIADGAVTAAKVAAETFPVAGRMLRVSAFASSGTWTKGVDVGSVMVQLVAGGGASYHASSTAGGSSSFGAHCSATGGGVPASASSAGGAGGTGSSGDINLLGGTGELVASSAGVYFGGAGGRSLIGPYGAGGTGTTSNPSSGGGAGGYCAKLIQRASLGSTEAVTVGAGGTNPASSTTPGTAGIVIVYEYSL